ncbi:MAG: 30S ribosomal protein S4e [Nitrososphaerales archaeon]
MGKISGSTKLKRQMAPAFWQIGRKDKRFALTVSPGTHPISKAYPLGVVLRDILKVANTMREARQAIISGEIKVDGVIRYDIHFPVGLMDVIEIAALDKTYRLVPKDSVIITPVEIPKEEKNVKLCKVTHKVTISGKKLQYGFHDGRTLVDNQKVNVNDTCLLTVPEQKVTNTVKLEKGSTALVISGDNAGSIGKVDDIREGTFILPKRVLVKFKDRTIELPVDMVMVVGVEKPLIKVE